MLYAARVGRTSIRGVLKELKDAGVTSLPGTSAEVLVPRVRDRIAGARITTSEWKEVISTAHEVGLPTTSTVMYGHCETAAELAEHLILLRDMQRVSTGSIGGICSESAVGFTEFVPLSFVAADAPMATKRESFVKESVRAEGTRVGTHESAAAAKIPSPMRRGPSGEQVLLLHAVARIALNRDIPNIQASWVKEGPRMAQLLLQSGCNDLGGTLINESISTAAGAKHGQLMKPSQIRALVRGLNPEMAWGDGSADASSASAQPHDGGELRYPW